MRELEIYSLIEPIGGMVGVSDPDDTPSGGMTEAEATAMFGRMKRSFERKAK